MKIPTSDLAKIQSLLDRFIFISEGTEGASEHFFWRCMAKHRMKTIPKILITTPTDSTNS